MRYRRMNWFLRAVTAVFLVLGTFQQGSVAEPLVRTADAAQAIQAGAVILDVRSPEEFSEGHLPKALNIPHNKLKERLAELPPQARESIVVYCRSGGRAGQAEVVLREAGFRSVINGGGFDELEEALKSQH